jgi:valyl-tRNA synthetase
MPVAATDAPLEGRWIVAELHATAGKVNQLLEDYRFDEAANTIYQFFWGSFCDWYLEIVKLRLYFSETAEKAQTKAALTTLVSVFEAALRLLSPFMPFLTEELWHAVYDGNPPAKSIALTIDYPQGKPHLDDEAVLDMLEVQALIVEVRALRKELGVEEKAFTDILLRTDRLDAPIQKIVQQNKDIVERVARVSKIVPVTKIDKGLAKRSKPHYDVAIIYERQIDIPAERDRLTKDIAKYEKGLAAAERQLGNEGFLAKAPTHVIEGLKKQETETRLLLEKARAALDGLPKE